MKMGAMGCLTYTLSIAIMVIQAVLTHYHIHCMFTSTFLRCHVLLEQRLFVLLEGSGALLTHLALFECLSEPAPFGLVGRGIVLPGLLSCKKGASAIVCLVWSCLGGQRPVHCHVHLSDMGQPPKID